MINAEILVTRKDNGKKITTIFGRFLDEDSLRKWVESQSKNKGFRYESVDPKLGENEVLRDDNSGDRASISKRQLSTSTRTRKRRKKNN